MSITQKQQALTNALRSFNFNPIYFIEIGDKRMGQKFAIASRTETSLKIHSNYMTYEEMDCYLMGYNKALTNPL